MLHKSKIFVRGPFVSQGPLGLWTTLSRRDRAWAPDAPCATLPGTIYLPFLFLLLFSLMTITHTVLPPLSAFLLAFLLPPVYPLFALAASLGDLAAGSDAARRPDVSFLRVRIAFNHVCSPRTAPNLA